MAIKIYFYCKNKNCIVVLNGYNMDCACINCSKEIKHCNSLDCADNGVRVKSDDVRELYMRKCHGCMQFSRYLLSQRNR